MRYRRGGAADLALFHEFAPPPTGGGHQFLRALVAELERRGLVVELNRISRGTPVCLFNSFNFDFRRLRRFARADCRMVHRVDGPIGVYRGWDDGTDARIEEINRELADATVVQSRFSLDAHRELGIALHEPVVIGNAVDPALFHPPATREPLAGRKLRLIATSWSDNPNKGADVFRWLDRNLDTGPLRADLRRAAPPSLSRGSPWSGRSLRARSPRSSGATMPTSQPVATIPARTRSSRRSPAVFRPCTGRAGVTRSSSETPACRSPSSTSCRKRSDRLAAELEERRAAIHVVPLEEVADRYLEVLRP